MSCKVCSNPAIFGRVNADVVRRLSLKELSHKYRLSGRVLLTHIRHLPELLESGRVAPEPSIFIGQVTYNFNLVAPVSEEDAQGIANVGDPDLHPEEGPRRERHLHPARDQHQDDQEEAGTGHA